MISYVYGLMEKALFTSHEKGVPLSILNFKIYRPALARYD